MSKNNNKLIALVFDDPYKADELQDAQKSAAASATGN